VLRDTLADKESRSQPEEALIEQDERMRFRKALATALNAIPPKLSGSDPARYRP